MKIRDTLFVFFGSLSILFSSMVSAQVTGVLMSESVSPLPENIILPQFKGGEGRMFKILEANLVYPPEAKREGVTGIVVVQFVVDSTGTVDNIMIVEGVRQDLNFEAARLIGLLKDWTPASINGRNVGVVYKLPLRFSLGAAQSRQHSKRQDSQLAPFKKWHR